MMSDVKNFRLSAIRLVGFHNYSDVLIPVRGDLFIVGANESGKTTILDGVHLVLAGEQHLDWNAAASLTGPKQSGRSFQGIILQADLAGQPKREGGSIAYAVVELQPIRSNGRPLSLVFGASAIDMHTQVHRWATIVNRPAADVPLTIEQADGSSQILDRDELETRLNCRIYKGSRGIGEYRTAIAERLFTGRSEFDEVTALWRTAKSYRELARTARSIGEVIRQVLPAPDPEPFQKIAKGFRDIAEIEEDLLELSCDVESLHKLRTLLIEARDARESLRRYLYVQAYWREHECFEMLEKTQSEKRACADRLLQLAGQIDELETHVSSLKVRLAHLRESDGYKLVAHLEATEERLAQADKRVARLGELLGEQKGRIHARQGELQKCRSDAESAITSARVALDGMAERLLDTSVELAECILDLQSRLPEAVGGTFDTDSTSSMLADLRRRFGVAAEDVGQQVRDIEQRQETLQSELREVSDRLHHLEQHADLVPTLPGLDEVLTTLQEQGIAYKLLYQELNWKADVSVEIQSAVEAAFGLSQLASIVVLPDDTAAARQVVLDRAVRLRILDASPVLTRGAPTDGEGRHRLLDFVVANDVRVAAHLQSTVGDVQLVSDDVPDGTNAVWFAENGVRGDKGARWRLELREPCWIDAQRRRELRQSQIDEHREAEKRLQRELEQAGQHISDLRATRRLLEECRGSLDELQLPWSIQQPLSELRRSQAEAEQLENDAKQREGELAMETQQRNELWQSVEDLHDHIKGTDAKAVKKQVEDLETEKDETEGQLVQCRADHLKLKEKRQEFGQRIARYEADLADGRQQTNSARHNLAGVVAEEHLGNLNQYVFETKRGGQLKKENLDENIRSADRREAELLAKLCGGDGVMNDKLAMRYGFRLEDDGAALLIRDRGDLDLDEILNERREQERQMHESLSERTRDLFETIFARDLTERLRADLLQVRCTINDINKKLEPLVFGNSRFQLHARSVTEHRRLVELIERQTVLNAEAKEELRHYLEDRRDQLMTEGDVPQFLDYRYWFDYSFKLAHVALDSAPSLGSEDIVRGSVGAQTTHNYLLLMALAALLFDRCKAKLRLLMLDDAFFGLDAERKELLLRCGKQLDLDFIIATPDLDGTIQEHAGDSTTVLVEKDEQERVCILPFEWERIPDQGDLFSKPRPEAVLGRVEEP